MVDYNEIVSAMYSLAKENNLKKPYAVGGIVRDRILHGKKEINDVDLTNGTVEVLELGFLMHEKFPNTFLKIHKNRHISIHFSNLQIDFSNSFKMPFVKQEMEKLGADSSDELLTESYSRDFTMNTLLLDLRTNDVIDPTKMGLKDINDKIVRTPTNPELAIKYDPSRILRALRLAVELDFTIDDSLKAATKKYADLLSNVSKEAAKEMMARAVKKDPHMTVQYIEELGIGTALNNMGLLEEMQLMEKISA